MHVVLAGGGTAGHIEPALNTADALRRRDPAVGVTMLGTERGLETRLVPARGYELRLIPPVPLPRRLTSELLRMPSKVSSAVAATAEVLADVDADVVVGFGGYVSLPAYIAARKMKIPVVVHEANMRPGLANRVGARFAAKVATAAAPIKLPRAQVVGIPIRTAISELDRGALRGQARETFGLDPDRPTLFVFGGSQGARSVNTAVESAAGALADAGIQVLHAAGAKNTVEPVLPEGAPPYVVLPYVDRMDLAYAAADLAVCRSGAMTCAELTAVGLPAVFVPLPTGNGEQRLNADPIAAAGGGLIVEDADFDADYIADSVVGLLSDPDRLRSAGEAAAALGNRHADEALAELVFEAAGGITSGTPTGPPPPTPEGWDREEPVIGWQPGSGTTMTLDDLDALSLAELGPTHFIAIGGSGMSAVARVLAERGVPVAGSDANSSAALRSLGDSGIPSWVGHRREQLGDARTVVISTAIPESNVELAEARSRGLRVLHRAAALALLMHGYRGVAVSGTHGKTTTTWMTILALRGAGLDPSYVVGADLDRPGTNGHQARGAAEEAAAASALGQASRAPVFVAEADESDRSFLLFTPTIAVVTNVEADHLDHYADLADITATFEEFVGRIGLDGTLIAALDDPGARALAENARAQGVRVLGYATEGSVAADTADLLLCDLREAGSGVSYRPRFQGKDLGEVSLAVPGRHMALNSAAALLAGLALGRDADALVRGLGEYRGARRRFELKGTANGVRLYDDYGHHPTEIAATLAAARPVADPGRLILAFQATRYSRVAAFLEQFGQSLGGADELVLMDVVGVGEEPIPGADADGIAAAVPEGAARVHRVADRFEAAPLVVDLARPGDVILIMGAPGLAEMWSDVLGRLEAREQQSGGEEAAT